MCPIAAALYPCIGSARVWEHGAHTGVTPGAPIAPSTDYELARLVPLVSVLAHTATGRRRNDVERAAAELAAAELAAALVALRDDLSRHDIAGSARGVRSKP
jgi:hypothetical protein